MLVSYLLYYVALVLFAVAIAMALYLVGYQIMRGRSRDQMMKFQTRPDQNRENHKKKILLILMPYPCRPYPG